MIYANEYKQTKIWKHELSMKKNVITQRGMKQLDSLGQESFASDDIICILLWKVDSYVPANLQLDNLQKASEKF